MRKAILIAIIALIAIAVSGIAQTQQSASDRSHRSESYSSTKFRGLGDVFDFLRPSKTFATRDGDLKIVVEDQGDGLTMVMYFCGKLLSYVGWSDPDYVAHGDYARLAVRTDGRQVNFVIHLPDASHSKPYMYFEPLGVSTNAGLATALRRGANINVPNTSGWEKFEPILYGDGASLSFEPCSTKPCPSIYYMK